MWQGDTPAWCSVRAAAGTEGSLDFSPAITCVRLGTSDGELGPSGMVSHYQRGSPSVGVIEVLLVWHGDTVIICERSELNRGEGEARDQRGRVPR